MLKIYHNPRCRKSRAGLEFLRSKNVDFTIVEYFKDLLSEDDLKRLLMKLHLKPTDIIRTQEEVYRKQFKGKNFTDEEWIKILVENPKLIQRPIIEKEHKAVIGDPVENIEEII